MKLFVKVALLLMVISTVSSCSSDVKKFSEKSPYAVELRKVRSFYDAKSVSDRLEKMGLESYVILIHDENDDNSKWFSVLIGSESSIEKIAAIQGVIEDVSKIKNTTVLNFNELAKRIEFFDEEDLEEAEKITAYDPDIPENITELINKFPKDNSFIVQYISLHNFPKTEVPRSVLKSFFDAKLDLPRGISKKLISLNALSFAEVIFEDNLYGDQVTIEIIKLKENNDLGKKVNENAEQIDLADGMAKYLSELILNTGRYRREEIEPIEVKSFVPLKGYKVLIEPRKDYVRTYMILIDESSEYAIFSQSTAKTDDEILSYLEGFGKSEGMLAYNEFYNTFYTIPKCLQNGDIFLGYSSSILDNSYARSRGYVNWSKAMVGHLESSAHFYNCLLDKSWVASAFDLLTPSKKNYIYGDMYAGSKNNNKTPLKVNGQNGYFVTTNYQNYNEVNFSTTGRHVMAIGGFGMSKDELHKRALSFQHGNVLQEENVCDEKYFLTFWAANDFTSGNSGSPGHAFVSFAHEDHDKQMTVFDGAWGFYPKNRGGNILERAAAIGEVPGAIVDDIKEGTPKDQGYTILVSKEEYDGALSIKNEWSSKKYQLTVNDCISFAEAIARSIDGLKVPNRKRIFNKLELQPVDLGIVEVPLKPEFEKIGYFPKAFMSELISSNKDNNRDLCQ